jgi:hypothetical protein
MIRKDRTPKDNGDGTSTVCLSRGLTALIDTEDASLVSRYTWIADYRSERQIYALAQREPGGKSGKVRMHRLVMGCTPGDGSTVDHISHNGIDNRKSNLRLVTRQQNCFNSRVQPGKQSSKFKGVTFGDSAKNPYCAAVTVGGAVIHIGLFADEISAARAYNVVSRIVHGEFAVLNDVTDGPITVNPQNLSGYRGVCTQRDGTFKVRVWDRANKGHIDASIHRSAILAALEYNDIAYRIYGDAANLNFIGSHLSPEAAVLFRLPNLS